MKTYILLRNNHESGPFALEQIITLNLQKHDLIWIEDHSFTWKYPSEIYELRSFAPVADHCYASFVYSRKEKQIHYFQLNYQELNYKKLTIDSITVPDAILADVPVGFEYMVNPISIRKVEYEPIVHINKEVNVDIPVPVEAEWDAEPFVELSYDNCLGEESIDTPEVLANPEFFESAGTFTWFYDQKRRKKRRFFKMGFIEMMIIGICLVSFIGLGYLIQSNSYSASKKLQTAYNSGIETSGNEIKMPAVYKDFLLQQEKAIDQNHAYLASNNTDAELMQILN